jgi:hypothetical protein
VAHRSDCCHILRLTIEASGPAAVGLEHWVANIATGVVAAKELARLMVPCSAAIELPVVFLLLLERILSQIARRSRRSYPMHHTEHQVHEDRNSSALRRPVAPDSIIFLLY